MATELEAIGINIIPSNRDDINSIFNVKTSTEYSTILAIQNLKEPNIAQKKLVILEADNIPTLHHN